MLTIPFLTQLDSRAKIKGSRDPLGIQPIWSRLGRHVVANLTTVSNSTRDFTVLLLGYHFVERVADAGGGHGDLATFLKWEQLAAYARASVNKEKGFRGTERVWRRVNDEERLRLGVGADAQILGDQKIYGLWGLYTVSGKASGLLEGEPTRLTVAGRAVVEGVLLPQIETAVPRSVDAVVERLSAREWELDLRPRSRDTVLLQGVAKALGTLRARQRESYEEHLVQGGPADADLARGTGGRQKLLADLLAETLGEADWDLTPETMRTLVVRARPHGDVGQQLAFRLERICVAEALLAPAAVLFGFLLGCDGQTPAAIARDVKAHWGNVFRKTLNSAAVEALEPELQAAGGDAESGRRWVRLAQALHEARYEDAIRLLLDQNASVMRLRGDAAPWVVVRDGKLDVRFRDERPDRLPEASALPTYWRHPYFIKSLRDVVSSVRGGA